MFKKSLVILCSIFLLTSVVVSALPFFDGSVWDNWISGFQTKSSSSCDITPSPAIVDINNDYGQNPGRVTVFGSADGKFNENTKVEINCNVDSILPGANENIVAAKVTPSTSQLSYSGYCTYKTSSQDLDYKVGVTISLDDVVCSGGFCYSKITCNQGSVDYAKVTVKSSTKVAVTPTQECGLENQKPCTTCPTGKTCNNGCLPPYVINEKGCGRCPSGTIFVDGICSVCSGGEGEFVCSDRVCNKGLAINADGICEKSPCGMDGQKICTTCVESSNCYYGCYAPYTSTGNGGICRPCSSDRIYTAKGYCVLCGLENQKVCSDGTCKTGFVPKNGQCVQKESEHKVLPEVSKDQKEIRFALDWKWSLIGVPYGEISSEDHSCVSKIYWYDPKINAFMTVTDLKDKKLIGKGLWAKRVGQRSTDGDCIIKYTGKFLTSQTIELKKGWNLISVQTERGMDTTKSSCTILKGPFTYSGFIENGKPQGYYKRDYLNPGIGYFINVADDCKLSNEEKEEAPPALPA